MDSTNEIENAAVAQRWVSEMHVRARTGVVWTVSGGAPRSAQRGGDDGSDACERRVDLLTDRPCIPTCRARWW
jgi:hypothetical protein